MELLKKERMIKVNISQKGIDLIKKFEGCRLNAYKCPANVWTIGYGTTSGVTAGMKINYDQAEMLLKKDLEKFENGVNGLLKVKVSQNQFDALVSFAYNCGLGALGKSALLEKLNKGDFKGASNEFARWNKGGGEVLQGLVNRRAAERSLFDTPVKEEVKKQTAANPPTHVYYTVKKGDILGNIAKRYGTTASKIKFMNPKIKDINLIYVGQKIRVK